MHGQFNDPLRFRSPTSNALDVCGPTNWEPNDGAVVIVAQLAQTVNGVTQTETCHGKATPPQSEWMMTVNTHKIVRNLPATVSATAKDKNTGQVVWQWPPPGPQTVMIV